MKATIAILACTFSLAAFADYNCDFKISDIMSDGSLHEKDQYHASVKRGDSLGANYVLLIESWSKPVGKNLSVNGFISNKRNQIYADMSVNRVDFAPNEEARYSTIAKFKIEKNGSTSLTFEGMQLDVSCKIQK